MTNFAEVLGAAAGMAILLIMAVVPLALDHYRPRQRPMTIPAQRGPVAAGRVRTGAARAVAPRA